MITVQKNTQIYFKQFQSLTIITWLEIGITDGFSVSLVSPWRWRSAAKLAAFYIVIIRYTENF
jgi:hypothetical protein